MKDQLSVLVDLAKQEGSTINTIWGFYITICVGIVGWFTAHGGDISPLSRKVIAFSFIVFTVLNWLSLRFNYALLDAFLTDIKCLLPTAMPNAPATAAAIRPTSSVAICGNKLPFSLAVVQPLVSVGVAGLILRW